MANTFNDKVTRFTAVLDKIYKKASLTGMLERPNTEWIGANKIKRPDIEVDGAGDYDRSDGYVLGGVEVSYTEYELDYDRGRKFHIDVIDDDETGFALYQEAAVEYVRTKEAPEIDAVRFARFAAGASTSDPDHVNETDTPDAIDEFDDAMEALDNAEVPDEGRIAFVSPTIYKGLKEEFQSSGRWEMTQVGPNGVELSRHIATLDGVPIIKVPQSRFYDVIDLQDGTTGGQEAGGYVVDTGTTKELHMIVGDVNAMEAYAKRSVSKIISPEVNQDADAWIIAYRMHHDALVPTNKDTGLYVVKKSTAVS